MKWTLLLGSIGGILALALLSWMGVLPDRDGRSPRALFDETRSFRMPADYVSEGDGIQGAIAERAWYGCLYLAERMRAKGWTVAAASSSRLSEPLLDRADIVIMMSPGAPGESEGQDWLDYSDEEIGALVSFVRDGGGLYIHGMPYFSHETWIHSITDPFGIGFALGGQVLDLYSCFMGEVELVESSALEDHRAIGRAERFYFYGGYIEELGDATPIAWSEPTSWFDRFAEPEDKSETLWSDYIGNEMRDTDEQAGPFPVVAVLKFGKGRVCIDSGLMLANQWASEPDTFELALSIMEWLGRR